MKKINAFFLLLLFVVTGLSMTGCASGTKSAELKIDYEKYTLANGLEVVLCQDKSDPIVSVAIQYHVGASREKEGKTGFAHFFEHMLFQRSENLPRNAFFQNINDLGGDFNGSTNQDGTNYYETVPRDALERVLWMESDRMGFFINTVTQGGLEREVDVVSNEKRQNYDNQPYGQGSVIMARTLYPKGHPYSWVTIGEIADLRSATIEDVKEFYNTYYKPANATLVIVGDFDMAQTKAMVEKYFGEIQDKGTVEKRTPMPVTLTENKLVMWEDNYARMPQLTLAFPSVEQYNEDMYALSLMTRLIAGDKKTPLYKVIVEEQQLAPSVAMYNGSQELAGAVSVLIRGFEHVDLNKVNAAVQEAFVRFEKEGFSDTDLEKLKVQSEKGVYNSLTSINGKALTMARNNVFAGKPDSMIDDLKKTKAVTREDIMRVYEKYIKGKNHVALSIVPKGQTNLALAGSVPADIQVESIASQSMKSQQSGAIVDDPYERTPSSFDRSVMPPLMSNAPATNVPTIWTGELKNGMKYNGITHTELPLTTFSIILDGGMLLDDPAKIGTANLYAKLLLTGTETKTPEEFNDALALLGANVGTYADQESIVIEGNVLSRNFDKTIALIEEAILYPRFDEKEFELAKKNTLNSIKQQRVSPASIANNVVSKLMYGKDHLFANSSTGSEESVGAITIDDLKNFKKFINPTIAKLNVVGDIDQSKTEKVFASMAEKWTGDPLQIPSVAVPTVQQKAKIYFIDYPGAQQSFVSLNRLGMPYNDPAYFPATVVNHKMGGGSDGRLFNVLRLQKGYTYGAYSAFYGGKNSGSFSMSSNIQSSKTTDAAQIVADMFKNYSDTYSETELAATKNALIRSNSGRFETQWDLLAMLSDISNYDFPADYIKQQEQFIGQLTLDQAKELIKKNMNYDEMFFLVVGDAKTQLKPLQNSGLGNVIVLDRDGNEV